MREKSIPETLEWAIQAKGIRTKDRALALALKEFKLLERENRRLLREAKIPDEVVHGLSDDEKDLADITQISHTIYYLHKNMIRFMHKEERLLLEIEKLKAELEKHGVKQDVE